MHCGGAFTPDLNRLSPPGRKWLPTAVIRHPYRGEADDRRKTNRRPPAVAIAFRPTARRQWPVTPASWVLWIRQRQLPAIGALVRAPGPWLRSAAPTAGPSASANAGGIGCRHREGGPGAESPDGPSNRRGGDRHRGGPRVSSAGQGADFTATAALAAAWREQGRDAAGRPGASSPWPRRGPDAPRSSTSRADRRRLVPPGFASSASRRGVSARPGAPAATSGTYTGQPSRPRPPGSRPGAAGRACHQVYADRYRTDHPGDRRDPAHTSWPPRCCDTPAVTPAAGLGPGSPHGRRRR